MYIVTCTVYMVLFALLKQYNSKRNRNIFIVQLVTYINLVVVVA